MKIESSLAAKKRIAAACELGHPVEVKNGEKKIAKKKKSCKRTKSCHVVPKTAIQILFDTCKEVFRGPGTVPFRLDVLKLRFVLDTIKPADVGIREDMPCFKTDNITQGTPQVTYMHIYQCPKFSHIDGDRLAHDPVPIFRAGRASGLHVWDWVIGTSSRFQTQIPDPCQEANLQFQDFWQLSYQTRGPKPA